MDVVKVLDRNGLLVLESWRLCVYRADDAGDGSGAGEDAGEGRYGE